MLASVELQANPDAVQVTVAQNGRLLECASAELKANLGVVLAAVTQNGSALQFASRAPRTTPTGAMTGVLVLRSGPK